MGVFKRFFLFSLLVLISPLVQAEVIYGVVVTVKDADTLVILTPEKQQVTIRLDSIDGPEKKMPFGSVAKKALSTLVFKKTVKVESHKKDRYGRTVGEVWLDNCLVNLEMVKSGMAWVYVKYARNPAYFEAEAEAKANKLGLWSQPKPQAPWEFRHQTITAQPTPAKMPLLLAAANTNTTSGLTCGSKRYCKQMNNRKEANFYLSQCGLKRLDRDGDGQACESLN